MDYLNKLFRLKIFIIIYYSLKRMSQEEKQDPKIEQETNERDSKCELFNHSWSNNNNF